MQELDLKNRLKKIRGLIDGYSGCATKDQSIPVLIGIYETLSAHLAYLRFELGEKKDQHIVAYSNRKCLRTKKMAAIAKKMADEGKKLVMSRVEMNADWSVLDQLEDEMLKEAEAEHLQQYCLGIQKVLSAIELRVNFHKFEKRESCQPDNFKSSANQQKPLT